MGMTTKIRKVLFVVTFINTGKNIITVLKLCALYRACTFPL